MRNHKMTTKTMMSSLIVLAMGSSSCNKFDPVGIYRGDASAGHEIFVALTTLQADGSRQVQSTRSSGSESNVQVTVRRVAEDRLSIAVSNGCTVMVEQSLSPNEHNTNVAISPAQRCTISGVEGYSGPWLMGGYANFEREGDGALHLSLSGSIPIREPINVGDVSGSWSFDFNGGRQ